MSVSQIITESLLIAFIGSAAAYSLWVWQGKPNAETGEYSTGMIFSNIARWLLIKYEKSGFGINVFKIALCPYCLSVWLCFGVALLLSSALISGVLAALITAPFVSLFLFIDNQL